MLDKILNKIDSENDLNHQDLVFLLKINSNRDNNILFKKALATKHQFSKNEVYLRGLIELSNICSRDCYYCGIRKGNPDFPRFQLSKEDVLECAEFAYKNNFASLVIQSGERLDRKFTDFIEETLIEIKERTENRLRITLSLGEHSEETYKRWYEAGAHRYLLRIETTNKELYNKIHPANYSFEKRVNCLNILKKIGYQMGTGVMIGLPGQTIDDLANDIIFFKEIDVDMIGMGPYIPHKNTPMGANISDSFSEQKANSQIMLGLKMIAVTRLFLKDINIASTTALQTLDQKHGLERGLLAGANVIMPNLTDFKYKKSYSLYDNKPCTEDSPQVMLENLNNRIKRVGEKIAFGNWGDSVHFKNRY